MIYKALRVCPSQAVLFYFSNMHGSSHLTAFSQRMLQCLELLFRPPRLAPTFHLTNLPSLGLGSNITYLGRPPFMSPETNLPYVFCGPSTSLLLSGTLLIIACSISVSPTGLQKLWETRNQVRFTCYHLPGDKHIT